MKSINNNITNQIIIEKSKFIGYGFRVDKEEDALNIINDLKDKYKGATHYCYAYIIDNIVRFNDDGEPTGTAGMPILNVLQNNVLDHVLVVIIRYFGGIKLGAGGLVRAYSNTTSDLIKNNIVELKDGIVIELAFEYQDEKNINRLLGNCEIVSKEYLEVVNYKVIITKELFEKIHSNLIKICISIKEKERLLI